MEVKLGYRTVQGRASLAVIQWAVLGSVRWGAGLALRLASMQKGKAITMCELNCI